MDAELEHFGIAYRKFVRVAAALHAWLPAKAHPPAARFLGRRYSPYLSHEGLIKASMRQALQLDEPALRRAWQQWLDSHGLFGLTVFDYGRPSRDWLAPKLWVAEPALLQRIAERGGLVLTYHSHHHNTLGCVLGHAGCHITGLAASTTNSPLYPYIGAAIDRVNENSARHFGGGGHLYTDEPRQLVRETNRLLSEGKVIVSLHDFSQEASQAGYAGIDFLGKKVYPPTGAVEIAIKLGVPIYAALLLPVAGSLYFVAYEIETGDGVHAVMQKYFDFLSNQLRQYPYAWQGWDWYHGFPDSGRENSQPAGPVDEYFA